MIIYLFIISAIVIYTSNVKLGDGFYEDYISVEKSTIIKGIFILFVFYRHIVGYTKFNNYIDMPCNFVNVYLEQLIVTLFLFYSGYGVFESIKCKKERYVNNIPRKRIFNVLIQFDIAIILYWIVCIIEGKQYGLKKMILTFIGWESIGNSNWYIFAILMTYIFTYISFKIMKNNHSKSLILVTVMSILYIFIMKHYKESYWYDTILCYPLGMWFSKFKSKIEEIIFKCKYLYITILMFVFFMFIIAHRYRSHIIIYEIWALLFVGIIVLITMKVSINSKVLYWFGKNLFGVYILQRIPMIVFKDLGLSQYNNYLYFLSCFFSTIILAVIFNYIINKLKVYIAKLKIEFF